MPDIDEVIEELESFDESIIRNCPQGCPYEWVANLRSRILKLLKDQQAEIELLKSAKNKAIEKLEIKIETRKVYRTGYFLGVADGLKQALDLIKKDGEPE